MSSGFNSKVALLAEPQLLGGRTPDLVKNSTAPWFELFKKSRILDKGVQFPYYLSLG